MFFPGVSTSHHHHHHGAHGASPYDDRDHSVVLLLTFAVFFTFVLLYLIVGVVWASVVTACGVALSFFYLSARRSAALDVGPRHARAPSGSGRLEVRPAAAVASAIPAFTYKRGSGDGGAGAGDGWAQCVVCLGIVHAGEVVRRLPACKHLFHVRCIDMWLRAHSTCPICRADVELAAGERPESPV